MSSVLLRTLTFVDLPIVITSAESRIEQRYTLIFASLSDWKLHMNLTSAVRSCGHVTMPLFLQDDTLFILFLWTVLFFAVYTTNKIYSWRVILCIHSFNKFGSWNVNGNSCNYLITLGGKKKLRNVLFSATAFKRHQSLADEDGFTRI